LRQLLLGAPRVLALANRIPVGLRAVRVGRDRLYADSLDRWAAALAWKFGPLERDNLDLVRSVVGPGAVAVDVGANVGLYTLALACAVGPGGVVHALEPDPANFRLLARATAKLPQVRALRAAATDRSGTVSLHVSPLNRGDHRLAAAVGENRETLLVPGITLDDLLAPQPQVSFVKLDIQGAEALALAGMSATLARNPDVAVLCELCPSLLEAAGSSAADVVRRLGAAGLAPFLVGRRGRTRRVSAREACETAAGLGYVEVFFRAT
jgi:FkbM family methyltransferase